MVPSFVKEIIKPNGQVYAILCSLNENVMVTKTMTIDWCNEILLCNVPSVHHPFDTDYTNMFRHNVSQDCWLEIQVLWRSLFVLHWFTASEYPDMFRFSLSQFHHFLIHDLSTGLFTTVIWLVGQVQINCSDHIMVMNSHRVFTSTFQNNSGLGVHWYLPQFYTN